MRRSATIGGGAGAGLGGAILVGSGTYATGDGSPAILGLSTPAVVLQDVSFQNRSLVLNGGALETSIGIPESLASLSVTGSAVLACFPGWASTLNFGSLAVDDGLAIWSYSDDDFITIASGTATRAASPRSRFTAIPVSHS